MRFPLVITFILSAFFTLAGNDFPVSEKYKNDKPKKEGTFKSPDFPGWLVMDIGFNSFAKNDPKMDIGFITSRSFGIYHMKAFEIGKKLSLNAAIGIATEKYNFKNDFTLGYKENASTGRIETSIDTLFNSHSKSQIAISFLEIPLEFRYYPTSSASDGGFFVALGGYAGLRLNSHTKVKNEVDGRNYTTKIKDEYGLNGIRYGVSARVGFRGASLYYKRNFSEFFSSTGIPQNSTFNPTTSTIGLSIALF